MFNPLKNVKKEQLEPKIEAPEINDNNDEIHYKEEVITNQNSTFEGVKVSDWQESGLSTISLLKVASKNVENKVQKTNQNIEMLSELIEEVYSTTEELSSGMEETAASTEEVKETTSIIDSDIEAIADKAKNEAKNFTK